MGPTLDEDDNIEHPGFTESLMHFLTIGWKVFFALIPPTRYAGGWLSFVIALFFIGLIVVVVAEFANLLGCAMGIKQSVTAITFVALGTSLPDTFASMTAARNSEFADSAVGNITGSNSVNVFLGLGLPWTIASIYYMQKEGSGYVVPTGTLAFSVALFLITSVICFSILALRRYCLQGELGGPTGSKYLSAAILVLLWLFYVTMSALQAYGVI